MRQDEVTFSEIVPMISPEPREDWIIRQARERQAAERAAFLDGACAGDAALRERLERLLAAPGRPEEGLAEGVDAATVKATIKLDFADEPDDEALGRTIGRYKLLERVGEGGCGVVYVAEQTEPVRRRVALKAWVYAEGGNAIVTVSRGGHVVRRHGRTFQGEAPLLDLGVLSSKSILGSILSSKRPLLAIVNAADKIQVWDWERQARVQEWKGALKPD